MSNNFPKIAMKSSLKDCLLNVFKLLESYIFFLAMQAIKIAVANCKTSFMHDQSSVTCNALWDWFKLAENGNVFEISFTSRVLTKE